MFSVSPAVSDRSRPDFVPAFVFFFLELRRFCFRGSVGLPLLLSPLLAAGAGPLPLFEAEYGIERYGLRLASVQRRLSMEGEEYLFYSASRTSGLAGLFVDQEHIEQSRFSFHGGELRPLAYSYRREGRKPRQREVRFDWQNGRLHLKNDERLQEFDLEYGIWDRLSGELHLMLDLQLNRLQDHYRLTDGRAIKEYTIVREQGEWLDTALGRFWTVRILHLRERDERRITFWCAEKLDYLPVRIEYLESNGARYTAQIEGYSRQ